MESVAVFLAAEAKRSWQHFIAISSAEKHLAASSPAHFSDLKSKVYESGSTKEKDRLPASAESVKEVKDELNSGTKLVGDKKLSSSTEAVVELSEEGMDPAIMEVVAESLEEWEYITMEDARVVQVDDLSVVRIQAECLVRELKKQAENVAASAALGRYLVAEHARRGENMGRGEEFCRVGAASVNASNREEEVKDSVKENEGGTDSLLKDVDEGTGVDIFAMDPVFVSAVESEAVKEVCSFEAPSEDPALSQGVNFVQESAASPVEGKDVSPETNGAAGEGMVDAGITSAAGNGITDEQGSLSKDVVNVDSAGGSDDQGDKAESVEGGMDAGLKEGDDDDDDVGVLSDKVESVEGRMDADVSGGGDGNARDQGVLRDGIEGRLLEGGGGDDKQGILSADEAKSSDSLSTGDGCEAGVGEEDSLQVSAPIPVPTCDATTNTQAPDQAERGTSPLPPPPIDHSSSQTSLSCADLLARVEEMRELELLKVELHVARANFNEEKSQRLVSEELIKIVQADVTSLTERNMAEAMARLQAENELTDLKVMTSGEGLAA